MENKKHWVTPTIQTLDIKKDTFSGSGTADEGSQSSTSRKVHRGTGGVAGTGTRDDRG